MSPKFMTLLSKVFLILYFASSFALAQEEESRLDISNRLFEEGKYKESFVILRELLKEEPLNNLYRFNIANNLVKMKLYDKAIKQYVKIVKRSKELKIPSLVYQSYCLRELGKRDEALSILYDVLKMELSDVDYNLVDGELKEYSAEERDAYIKKGQDRLDLGMYRAALEFFEKAWVIDPTDELYYLMGKTYFALGDLEEAENQFSYIRDDKVYKEAMMLIDPEAFEEKKPQKKARFYSVYMDLAYGKNSNPYTQAETSGTTITTDNQTDFYGGGVVRFISNDTWQLGLSGDHYRQQYSSDSSISSNGTIISMPLTYMPTHRKWDLTVSPQYEMTTYGGSDYTNNKVLSFTYNYYKADFRSSYGYSYTDYDPATSDYYYLNGTNHSVEATWTKYLKDQELSFGVEFGKESLDDTSSNIGSNSSYAATIGGYFRLREKWSLSTELGYTITQYQGDSSGFHQKDGAFEVSATLRWSLKNWVDVYLKDEFLANSSNLNNSTDNNNYRQNTLQLGLSLYY